MKIDSSNTNLSSRQTKSVGIVQVLGGIAAAIGISPACFAAVSSNNLEVYYSFDPATVSTTVVTDQFAGDGNADNLNRSALSTFTTGAKFGGAIDTSTNNGTPWGNTADAATINSTWLPGTGDYTLSFWYRQNAAGGFGNRIFSSGARGNDGANDDGLQIYALVGGGFEVAYHDPSIVSTTRDRFTVASGGATFDGVAWNLFTLVRTDTSLRLWLNGVDNGGSTLAVGYNIAVTSGINFREPAFGPSADTITNSAYDDAAIWHRALSSTEIGEIYNGGTGATIASLIPEPSSALLGALGVLALLRRRR